MIHLQSLFIGEAKALIDGYGCNGSLYAPALARLKEHFGNSNGSVNPRKIGIFTIPSIIIPDSYTQFSTFLLTPVNTFQQFGFNPDIHSLKYVNRALNNLPTSVAWKEINTFGKEVNINYL